MKSKVRNYEIQNRLGSGSYGVIFKVLNKATKQQCVLKQIKMNKMSEKAKKSTLNEATIMGKLIHPFIVQYKQSFVEDDTLHIVMEYCDNGDMSMYLKMQNKKPLKQQKIWKFFLQICLGLQYIHKNKILHRDIKSLNIFLNKNQDIKIGDLGVAKMLMANDFAQTIVGTPFYLSPQLCQQKPYNQKSDIWALGCLLYELCTFKHPFQAANQASLILKIIRGKYSPIPQFYSKQLKDVIDMCLQRDYKRRPTATMILQRSKAQHFINQFKLEQKIKEQYQKMKVVKQSKQTQIIQHKQPNQPNLSTNAVKPVENKAAQKPSQEKNTPMVKRQIVSAKVAVQNENKIVSTKVAVQNENKKVSADRKQVNQKEKRPSISGMPEDNIFLPDKNKIIEKLQPNNIAPLPKKQIKSYVPVMKSQQSEKKIRQNKEQFLKNLQKAVENNLESKRSPKMQKIKTAQQVSTSAVVEHQSRLQKIDLKIQEQLQKDKEIQKLKAISEKKKSQTPIFTSAKVQQKFLIDPKSVPLLLPKQNSRDQGKINPKPSEYQNIPPLPPKNKQQIIKVKMQQPPVQPKVFEANRSHQQKGKGIIKSRGFTHEIQQQANLVNKSHERRASDFKRNSTQNRDKPVLFGLDEEAMQKQQQQIQKNNISQKKLPHQLGQKSSQYNSERHIKPVPQASELNSRIEMRKQSEKQLFRKKPQILVKYSSGSRVRSKANQLSRNARNASKYSSEVTKQDEDVVMNLPDSLGHNNADSSDEEISHEKQVKMNKNFMLKDINNSVVLQKYEQIINSKSIGDMKSPRKAQNLQKSALQLSRSIKSQQKTSKKQTTRHFYPQQKVLDSQVDDLLNEPSICAQMPVEHLQFIPENQSLAFKTQQFDEGSDQILDESEDMIESEEKEVQYYQPYNVNHIEEEIYEVNNFNLHDQEQQNQVEKHYNNTQSNAQSQSEWSFDEQPQLPMLQDKQSPFFQQANPYLVVQQQQQTIQQKRNYLQIRLQQNIKREDEINKLMQIKIEECRAVVPKYFEQILEFFRKKINKQDQYTENDEREVEEFLRRKGLTDQRKFQNIYKIMHFEMELQNTRKIIQRICKKLAELENTLQQN